MYKARIHSFFNWSTDIKKLQRLSWKWDFKKDNYECRDDGHLFIAPPSIWSWWRKQRQGFHYLRIPLSKFSLLPATLTTISSFSHRYFKFLLRNWHFSLNLIFWIKVIGLWLIVLSIFGYRYVVLANHSPKICITSQI